MPLLPLAQRCRLAIFAIDYIAAIADTPWLPPRCRHYATPPAERHAAEAISLPRIFAFAPARCHALLLPVAISRQFSPLR